LEATAVQGPNVNEVLVGGDGDDLVIGVPGSDVLVGGIANTGAAAVNAA
jgi:Ca2+-binding RTX toxin-like protein